MYRIAVTLIVLLCLSLAPLRAEEVTESWRSPFGSPRAVAVNPSDGSLWAATGGSLMHVSASGSVLLQVDGFGYPEGVAVDPSDGSVWVADSGAYNYLTGAQTGEGVVHVGSTGAILWQGSDFGWPWAVAVNPADGTVWVADGLGSVSHLAKSGSVLWKGTAFSTPYGVSVDPNDGSCWVTDEGVFDDTTGTYKASAVVHVAATGAELWRSQISQFSDVQGVSVDPGDSSVWVADAGDSRVVHLSSSGKNLWTSGSDDFYYPVAVSVNEKDGSVWVADEYYGEVTHYSAAGVLQWRGDSSLGFSFPSAVAAASDGSCWAADIGTGDVIHISAAGSIAWEQGGMYWPWSVAVDWLDGSVWTIDGTDVVHLDPNGHEIARSSGFDMPMSVAVNLTDGSAWVADAGSYDFNTDTVIDGTVAHLSATGTQLWRGGQFKTPALVSVNPNDGTCWVLDWGDYNTQAFDYVNPAVVHLGTGGDEIWRETDLAYPSSIAASPTDGGCWVADTEATTGEVVHYGPDGSVVWSSTSFTYPTSIAVNAADGSVWVADAGTSTGVVTHLSPSGTEIGSGTGFAIPLALSPNPMDGTCWVADVGTGEVTHLDASGITRWSGGLYSYPSSVAVDPFDGSCWVADTDNDQIARLSVTGYPTPTPFWDVPLSQWAAPQISACVAAKIVAGYPNGSYHPSDPVTRDQMAVYISRALAGGDTGVPTAPAAASFPDVPTSYWAFKYVEYAKSKGIVSGYPDGTYQPTNPVDRGQMAVYIARAMANPTGDAGLAGYTPPATPTFPDVAADYYAYKYIEYIKSQGVAGGYPDGSYHPADIVTRDQMAVYVARAFGLK